MRYQAWSYVFWPWQSESEIRSTMKNSGRSYLWKKNQASHHLDIRSKNEPSLLAINLARSILCNINFMLNLTLYSRSPVRLETASLGGHTTWKSFLLLPPYPHLSQIIVYRSLLCMVYSRLWLSVRLNQSLMISEAHGLPQSSAGHPKFENNVL